MSPRNKKIRFEELFKGYLTNERAISARTANDYSSRCRHVQELLGVDLVKETACQKSYLELIKNINVRYKEGTVEGTAAYAVCNNLKVAVKKYAEFNHGAKVLEYPSHIRITS
jgi:hypothetical protein